MLALTVWSLPFLSGILLSLSSPIVDIGLFAWIGLVPLLVFISNRHKTGGEIFWGGVITGTIYGFFILWPLQSLNAWWWINPEGFFWNNKEFLLLLVLILTSFFAGGVFFGIFSYLYKRLQNNKLMTVLFFVVLWMFFERLREFFVFGFTWGHLGYSLHDYIFIMQLANTLGVYGLSGLIIAVNILIYLFFKQIYHSSQSQAGGLHTFRSLGNTLFLKNRFAIALTILFLAVNTYGYVVIKIKEAGFNEVLNIVVIHSGKTTEKSGTLDSYSSFLSLIEKTAVQAPDIIVAPENIFPFFVIDQSSLLPLKYEYPELIIREMYDKLRTISESNSGTSFIFGVHSIRGSQRFNSLVIMENGNITSLYNKRVLLPLAEKVPQKLTKIHIEPLKGGEPTQTVFVQGRAVTPLICSEIIYPKLAKQKESIFIVNISNDSVFTNSLVAKQNHIMAQLRAVENHKYVLRSVKNGVSSIIDPFGNVLKESSGLKEEILVGTIRF